MLEVFKTVKMYSLDQVKPAKLLSAALYARLQVCVQWQNVWCECVGSRKPHKRLFCLHGIGASDHLNRFVSLARVFIG